MASISRCGGLSLALIILIVVSLSFEAIIVADARIPYKHERQLLAIDCNSPVQGDIPGCGGGGGGGSGSGGSSRCMRPGCCGYNKMGECLCC